VVDDFGAAAAECAVQRPIVVKGEEVSDWSIAAPLGLAPADALARLLDDFAAGGDGLLGVDAALMDSGFADGELKLGVPWVDRRLFDENGSHDSVVSQIVPRLQ
jgi:hypothetical protein